MLVHLSAWLSVLEGLLASANACAATNASATVNTATTSANATATSIAVKQDEQMLVHCQPGRSVRAV